MRDRKTPYRMLAIIICGALFLLPGCGSDKATDSTDNGDPSGKELQLIRAYFQVTIQERINEWMIVGPAAEVDVTFYPQRDGDNVTLGRASVVTDNNGNSLYICVAGSLYVGDTFTLNAAAIRTGCATEGWLCSEQGNSAPISRTIVKDQSDYYCTVNAFATPQ